MVRIAHEIQGSRFASSVVGSLLYHLLSTEELPLKPSSSVSPAKAVTEHYGKYILSLFPAGKNYIALHTNTKRSQKVMLTSLMPHLKPISKRQAFIQKHNFLFLKMRLLGRC